MFFQELNAGRVLSAQSSLPVSLAAVEERLEHSVIISRQRDDALQHQLLQHFSGVPSMPGMDKV